MTLRVVTPPTGELVEMGLLKQQLEYVGVDDRDPLLAAHLAAATALLEAATQRRFLTQTLDWILPHWRPILVLPLAPAIEVVEVAYTDANGQAQVLPAAQYVVSPIGPTLCIRPDQAVVWPVTDPDAAEPVRIRFRVGYGTGVDAPASVRTAALMLTAHLVAHRGDGPAPELAASTLPPAVEALIGPERWAA